MPMPSALLRGDSNRFLSDSVIRELITRQGVIGIVPYNHFLVWEWTYPEKKTRSYLGCGDSAN